MGSGSKVRALPHDGLAPVSKSGSTKLYLGGSSPGMGSLQFHLPNLRFVLLLQLGFTPFFDELPHHVGNPRMDRTHGSRVVACEEASVFKFLQPGTIWRVVFDNESCQAIFHRIVERGEFLPPSFEARNVIVAVLVL